MSNFDFDKRRKQIENCGKDYRWVVSSESSWTKRTMYCNYINECPNCRSFEKKKRKKVIESHINNSDYVFRCVINDDEWTKLYTKIYRNKIDFSKYPQPDGTYLIVTNKDPKHKDFSFVEQNHADIIQELTRDENLFVENGRRSSSSNWSLTPRLFEEKEEENEEIIVIKTMEPRFSNNTSGYKVPYDDLYGILKACNTWSGGKVTKENAQEYITNSTGTLIALHLAAGYTWNKDESRIVNKTIKVSDIDNWKVHSVQSTERVYFGKDEDGNRLNKDTFYNADEKILAVIHGVVDIPDRISELEQYQIKQDDPFLEIFGE